MPANKFRFSHKFDLKDILIVGHGLAGAILSHSLLQAGQRVVVLEGKMPFSASSVAAGIINPLIGPKLNLPPQMGDCLKEAVHFHRSFAEEYAQNHLEKISLRRIFLSGQQREIWKKDRQGPIPQLTRIPSNQRLSPVRLVFTLRTDPALPMLTA